MAENGDKMKIRKFPVVLLYVALTFPVPSMAANQELCHETAKWLRSFSEARDNGVSIQASKNVFLQTAAEADEATRKIFLDAIDNIYVGSFRNMKPTQIESAYYKTCMGS